MAFSSTIHIQDLGDNHVLPIPDEYEYVYFRPSAVGFNAAGKPFVQPFVDGDDGASGTKEFILTWLAMTDAQVALLKSAWDGLTSQVCRYQNFSSLPDEYSVVRHPDMAELTTEAVRVAGGWRWRATIHMLQTIEDWEI